MTSAPRLTVARRVSLASLWRMRPEDVVLPSPGKGFFQLAVKLTIVLASVYAIHLMLDWATAQAEATGRDGVMIGVLAAILLAYAVLIAVPFMPGIEIGLSLLMLQGAAIAPVVYAATVLGLLLAFAAGRFLPNRWLVGVLADLRLRRACALVERLAPMSRDERLALLSARAPTWVVPLIGRWRYLLLAALINLPGNVIMGGGGGIAFTAGFSRLFHPVWTTVALVLAVMPVPIAFWLVGRGILPV